MSFFHGEDDDEAVDLGEFGASLPGRAPPQKMQLLPKKKGNHV